MDSTSLNEGPAAIMNRSWLALAAVALARRMPMRASLCAGLLVALSACNGTAVVTLTSTPSTDTFLTYRVGLVSVQLQSANGRMDVQLLPANTTVDLAQLVNWSEVLGSLTVQQRNYKQVSVTLDYGAAQIVYDDGSVNGVALTPVGSGGGALGQVTLTLQLDPANQFAVYRHSSSRLSLSYSLAASNIVNLARKTVTVTPLLAASASPVDTKLVRVRGALSGVDTANTRFTTTIVPFDFPAVEAGTLRIYPSTVTTYEVNGTASLGNAGLSLLSKVSNGAMTVAYGNLSSGSTNTSTGSTTTTTSCADGSTPRLVNGVNTCANGAAPVTTTASATSTAATGVSFSATEVLAGSSVQGSGLDRISGVVANRSGNTFAIEDGTLISSDGTNTFIQGTSIVTVGPGTQTTQVGTGAAESNGLAKISVGSQVYVFGTAGTSGSGAAALDATAGLAQLWPTSASGLVTVQGTGTVTLDLAMLGGRSLGAYNFSGTGSSAGSDSSPAAYQVTTGNLDLTNATVSSPVEVGGLVTPFGTAPPDFSAAALLDSTTINGKLVLDFGSGTAAPFASYDTTQIVLNTGQRSIGPRHEIETGAQTINIAGSATNPLIVPNATSTNTVFTIGHTVSGTTENFNTFSAYITQLQSELNGSVLVTGITAMGQYTTSSYTFSATSVTLLLSD